MLTEGYTSFEGICGISLRRASAALTYFGAPTKTPLNRAIRYVPALNLARRVQRILSFLAHCFLLQIMFSFWVLSLHNLPSRSPNDFKQYIINSCSLRH